MIVQLRIADRPVGQCDLPCAPSQHDQLMVEREPGYWQVFQVRLVRYPVPVHGGPMHADVPAVIVCGDWMGEVSDRAPWAG